MTLKEVAIAKAPVAAMKICWKDCPANYKTCERCQQGTGAKMPSLGNNDICPLARYNVPEQPEPDALLTKLNSQPSLSDCYTLCLACEHSEIVAEGPNPFLRPWCKDDEEWQNFCLDCPVLMARESLCEAIAEAGVS